MAVMLQGVVATAALSSSAAFDSKGAQLPTVKFLLERKGGFLVDRSDRRLAVFASNARARSASRLVTNAVAAKTDKSTASAASKIGGFLIVYYSSGLVWL
uniref:Uncharacterized protein n=1 Tax=Nelumbo nucifera TaxID=4432 RepID=A0A822Z1T0_NELNU|nr:TPA_asm: hypothetical protein HUJ06_008046 [Nelumbo nucifera]